jgi:choline dehydrogenase-like flavoprotein
MISPSLVRLRRGGLSNVWGASCYPLRKEDASAWPISSEDLVPHYARTAELLGLVQGDDDLARAYPLYGTRAGAAARNPDSPAEFVLAHWEARRSALARQGFAAGRTRLAVRPEGAEGDACRRCGLCFYGCSFGAIYSARRTLAQLGGQPGFRYRPGLLILDFREQDGAVHLRARRQATGAIESEAYDALFLAAGTLSSLRIAVDSLGLYHQPAQLLDNDMILAPVLLTSHRSSGRFRSAFTMGEAVLALDPGVVAPRGVHMQLYSFHEFFLAELAEVIAGLPAGVQRAVWAVLNNLLVGFIYLSGRDSVIASARVCRRREDEDISRIHIDTAPYAESRRIRKRLFRHLCRARRDLGFLALPALAKATPFGFSGHLAGSLPMSRSPGPLQTDADGCLAGTRRVYVVDAAALPALPAQNATYTVMANAMRVADRFAGKAASKQESG